MPARCGERQQQAFQHQRGNSGQPAEQADDQERTPHSAPHCAPPATPLWKPTANEPIRFGRQRAPRKAVAQPPQQRTAQPARNARPRPAHRRTSPATSCCHEIVVIVRLARLLRASALRRCQASNCLLGYARGRLAQGVEFSRVLISSPGGAELAGNRRSRSRPCHCGEGGLVEGDAARHRGRTGSP